MKLVLSIISDDDASVVISELMRASFSATKLSSTGGFLRSGNTTLMIGVEDERLAELMSLLNRYCKKRKQMSPAIPTYFSDGMATSMPVEITVGGATVFVLDVESFEKL